MDIRRQLQTLSQENASLQARNNELIRRQARYEIEIQKTQSLALELTTRDVWQPEEDNSLRNSIIDLHEYAREWADDYGTDDVKSIKSSWKESLPESLHNRVRLNEDGMPSFLGTPEVVTDGLKLLLTSLLTAELYMNMFENIFFLLDEKTAIKRRFQHRKKTKKTTGSSEEITRSTVLGDTYYQLSKCEIARFTLQDNVLT